MALSDSDIRAAQARVIKVFRNKPETARSTNSAQAVVRDGLKCTFTQDGHSAVMDMPEIMGGENAGPTPGFFGRAGVAGCVSIGIKQAAIKEGLDLNSVTVGIETDFDDAAPFGLGNNSAAPLETRLSIQMETSEPGEKVRDLVDRVLEMDPWFLALRDAQNVKISVMAGN